MEQQQPQPQPQVPTIPEYRIVSAPTLEKLEAETDKRIKEGWQILGQIGYAKSTFFHEMCIFRVDEEAIKAASQAERDAQTRFNNAITNMDSRVRDLLDINGIQLMLMDGKFYTKANGKVTEGIDAKQILALLKSSRHYPIDLDDNEVIAAIEGLA